MFYQEQKPSADLLHVIKHFWAVEYDRVDSEPEAILPDGCPEIVFNLADRFRRTDAATSQLQPHTLIAGQINRRLTIVPTGTVKLFGVRLTPTGAFALSRVPQSELLNTTPAFSSLFGRSGECLEDAVNSAGTFVERATIVETFVRRQLEISKNVPSVAKIAADKIISSGGNLAIADLASFFVRSERSLERDFREQVGITPKLFARIIRFQNVVRLMETGSHQSMIETALANGFFDQSHMIRDFKKFAGVSPREFFKQSNKLSEFFTATS